jgi:hypothetical protein
MVTPPKPFDMGNMALGGLGQMLESVDAVQRAWSNLSMPGSMMPTVDVGELEKRIADLKAVEQWLNANLAMLRGTIQGMEIQRGTLAAMQSFGASLGQGMPSGGAAAHGEGGGFNFGVPREEPAPAAHRPTGADAGSGASAGTGAGAGAAAGAGASQDPPVPGLDPTAWWNMLQRNFNQVAQSAMSGMQAMPGMPGIPGMPMPGGMPASGAGSGDSRSSGAASGRSGASGSKSGAVKSGARTGTRRSTGNGKAGSANGKPAASRGKKGR